MLEPLETEYVDNQGITWNIGVWNYTKDEWELVSKPFDEPIGNCVAFKPFAKMMATLNKELDLNDLLPFKKAIATKYDANECPNLAMLEAKRLAWAKRCQG